MSITKLATNHQDGVVKGVRKYQMVENQDNTVSFEDMTEFIRPEYTVDADLLNDIDDTINQVIDLAEENASDISDVDDDIDAIIDGDQKIKKATYAQTAINAGSVTSATTADSAGNDFYLITRQRLNFTNNTLTIYDDRITANSVADIYFTEETASIAKQADIDLNTDVIRLIVSANNTPTGDIVATIKVRVV